MVVLVTATTVVAVRRVASMSMRTMIALRAASMSRLVGGGGEGRLTLASVLIGLVDKHGRVQGLAFPLLLPIGVVLSPVFGIFHTALGRGLVAGEERKEGALLAGGGIDTDRVEPSTKSR